MIPAAENFHPFFVDAGGIRLRAARFDAAIPAAICLLMNGQTEFIEKYFEVIDELRGRGFSVITFRLARARRFGPAIARPTQGAYRGFCRL